MEMKEDQSVHKRRTRGSRGNFTIRLNERDFDKINELCRITGKSKRSAILYAVNQYIGDYEINNERRTF